LLLALVVLVSLGAIAVVSAVIVVTVRGRAHSTPAVQSTATATTSVEAPPPPSAAPSALSSAAVSAGSASASASPEVPDAGTHFNPAAARKALDAASHEVAHCRKDKTWGSAKAKITFAGDGSITQVALGPPFRGTASGDCVTETLSAVHAPPFAGKPATIEYTFFVAH
jgi:cytoskeletal protein RodZ